MQTQDIEIPPSRGPWDPALGELFLCNTTNSEARPRAACRRAKLVFSFGSSLAWGWVGTWGTKSSTFAPSRAESPEVDKGLKLLCSMWCHTKSLMIK